MLQNISYVDAIERALKDAILSGEYPADSRLPAERELAERFGVNRVTLRSALTRVAQAGLLEVRQGRGYTVRDYRRHGTLDIIEDLLRVSKESPVRLLEDLLRLRRGLVFATLDALPEDPARLQALCERAEPVVQQLARARSREAITELEIKLTRMVVEATGSQVLQLLMKPQIVVARSMSKLTGGRLPDAQRSLLAWRLFFEWLKSPQRSQAQVMELLRQHDQQTLELLKDQGEEHGPGNR